MKILCLYNNPCAEELFDWIEYQGHDVIRLSERFSSNWCKEQRFELAVSYTYRFILDGDQLAALNNNVVNIHNSYLPWNRGADPNIWSIIDNTPRGVTLHYMDTNLDKGYIIAQAFVNDSMNETLASSYNNLDKAAKELFKNAFRWYQYWPSMKKSAIGNGNYHSIQDGKKIKEMIVSYEQSVEEIRHFSNYRGNVK